MHFLQTASRYLGNAALRPAFPAITTGIEIEPGTGTQRATVAVTMKCERAITDAQALIEQGPRYHLPSPHDPEGKAVEHLLLALLVPSDFASLRVILGHRGEPAPGVVIQDCETGAAAGRG
ncbi:hypothetical protein [Streptomyces sp. MNP-20]|uniref:hypothetical protein n=1 Tax=Streptomyces sp. MNP-20 TaxID=2721165 RepID=UPI00155416A4|nr:hypothetical protein [Streptomyces sp. MNP-20]